MILKFLCDIFFWLINFIIGLFPTFPSFSGLNPSLEPVLYVLQFINMFISIKAVSACLITILIVFNIKFVWSILMWLIRKIPGVS